jgi:thioesterase domain-containing protein
MGGLIVLEMAQQLRARGYAVPLVALLDTQFAYLPGIETAGERREYHVGRFREHGIRSAWKSAVDGAKQLLPAAARDAIRPIVRRSQGHPPAPGSTAAMQRVYALNYQAARHYRPNVYPGRLVFYLARDAVWSYRYDSLWGWRHLAGGGLEVDVVPGDHRTVLSGPTELAAKLRTRIAEITAGALTPHPPSAPQPAAAVAGASDGGS